MTKFQKRLSKLTKNNTSALVVGTAFGQISQILNMYSTVFVVNEDMLELKARNLIYRQTIDRLSHLVNVGIVFLDIKHIDKLENLQPFWKRNNSLVLIEGNDAISRELSKPLYDSGWRCTSLQGSFHVWEQNSK